MMFERSAPRRRNRSACPPPELWARTLPDLRKNCDPDGEAAVQEARMSAMTVWVMNGADTTADDNTALALFRDSERARLNIPRLNGKAWVPKLACYGNTRRAAVNAIGNRLLNEWEAAGSPGIEHAIGNVEKLVRAAQLHSEDRSIALAAVEQLLFTGGSECRA